METNPSPPNKNGEGDRDQDTTAQWQLSGRYGQRRPERRGHRRPACQPDIPGKTRQVPAVRFLVRQTGSTTDSRTRSQGTDTQRECGRVRVRHGGRDRGTQDSKRRALSEIFNALRPTTRVSPLLLPHHLPPAPRPRPGHLGPHPLRGLGSGSCSARLPRGGSCPKAAAGAAGAWPSEGISGVGPWGRLGRDGWGGVESGGRGGDGQGRDLGGSPSGRRARWG